jgi:hypothetical protein
MGYGSPMKSCLLCNTLAGIVVRSGAILNAIMFLQRCMPQSCELYLDHISISRSGGLGRNDPAID